MTAGTPLKFNATDGSIQVVEKAYETRTTCRACLASALEPVLDLGEQYLPRFVPEVDLTLPKAPLALVRCENCGLLQLQHTVNPDLLFRKYWYRSSVNQTMKDQLTDLVDHGLQYHREGHWLDIGANDGFLLSRVPRTFVRIACEPAEDFRDGLRQHADAVIPTYFSADNCPGPYDVVTSAACFYDVEDPGKFVGDVAQALAPDGVWINQLSDAPTMLKKNAFDAICHEHLTYYSVPDLERLYRQHGLIITRVQHNDVNGGSVRVVARKTSRQREDLLGMPKVTKESATAFARRVRKWKDRMLDLCHGTLSMGKSYCMGASTKGTVLLQYLGAECFQAVGDRNPLKFGTRMVGSWLPVVSEEEMRAAEPRYVLVLPWGLAKEEFLRREREMMEAGATLVFPLPTIEMVV